MPVIIAHADECDIAHGPTREYTANGLNADGDLVDQPVVVPVVCSCGGIIVRVNLDTFQDGDQWRAEMPTGSGVA